MTLTTLSEILRPCVGKNWAVGAYDTPTLDTTQAIVDAAVADQAPVIFMLYPGHIPSDRWITLAAIVRTEVERSGIPAAMVLDHGQTLDQIKQAIDLGFTGVMIDASTASLEDNIALTSRVVELARPQGVSVEAELGHVGGGQEELSESEQSKRLTRVDDAERFVRETEIDALAVAIGTAHGLYRVKPRLDLERLAELRQRIDIPLVLHGSSGTPDDALRRAIEIGIDKLNVWADVRMGYLQAVKAALEGPIEKIEVYDLADAGRAAACQVIQQKNQLFGAVGKANLYT